MRFVSLFDFSEFNGKIANLSNLREQLPQTIYESSTIVRSG